MIGKVVVECGSESGFSKIAVWCTLKKVEERKREILAKIVWQTRKTNWTFFVVEKSKKSAKIIIITDSVCKIFYSSYLWSNCHFCDTWISKWQKVKKSLARRTRKISQMCMLVKGGPFRVQRLQPTPDWQTEKGKHTNYEKEKQMAKYNKKKIFYKLYF